MNIHDKERKLVEQAAAKLKEELKPLEDILQQDDKALEKLDQLIHKAEKDAQNAVAEEIKVNPTEGEKRKIPRGENWLNRKQLPERREQRCISQ